MNGYQIVGFVVQMTNNRAIIEHAKPMLELGLRREAEKHGLTLTDERDYRYTYGNLVPTGGIIVDVGGDELEAVEWVSAPEQEAKYVRVRVEGTAQ